MHPMSFRSAKSFATRLLLPAVATCITLAPLRAQTSGLDNELRQWLTEPGRTYPLLTATFAGREILLYDFGPTTSSAGDVYRLPDGNLLSGVCLPARVTVRCG